MKCECNCTEDECHCDGKDCECGKKGCKICAPKEKDECGNCCCCGH